MASEIFDQAAADWDKNEHRLILARNVAAAILQAVPIDHGMTALEIGCGTGLVTMELAGKLKAIVATDSSNGMLHAFAAKINREAVPNITPLQVDFTTDDAQLSGRTFDLVYSSMTLHHIRDTAGLLRVCHRLLKPGGWLAAADLEPEDGSFHGDMPGVEHHGFQLEKLSTLAAGCGFTQVKAARIHVVNKTNSQGRQRGYPVFLLTGRRA